MSTIFFVVAVVVVVVVDGFQFTLAELKSPTIRRGS